ncbi:MAG: hypothetical protein V3U43_00785, partial [Pseudomonadales bacterium]
SLISATASTAGIIAADEVNEDAMDRFDALYQPVLREIEKRSLITDQVLDKDVYRIYVATLWVNAVTDPDQAGIEERELELLHDYLNERIPEVLGRGTKIRDCFRFVASRDGEEAMERLRVRGMHRDLLLFFCSMILNPEAHQRWMEAQRKKR